MINKFLSDNPGRILLKVIEEPREHENVFGFRGKWLIDSPRVYEDERYKGFRTSSSLIVIEKEIR